MASMGDCTVNRQQRSSPDLKPGMITIIGVPFDENSSFMRGAALAPARIREALHSGAMNLCAENGIDLAAEPRWQDLGDLELSAGTAALAQIEAAIGDLLAQGVSVLALGGDHAVTYPIIRAYGTQHGDLTILHLDAHPDLYDEFEGNRYSHACPFARIMEERPGMRLVQVGIRTMNPHQRAQAERFNVEVIDMGQWGQGVRPELKGPVYLSLDMDVLDPAFAPGTSHHEPGGLSTREVLQLLHNIEEPIVGADIVEFNPDRDPLGITATVAAKFAKEISSLMLAGPRLAVEVDDRVHGA
jgi:arginase